MIGEVGLGKFFFFRMFIMVLVNSIYIKYVNRIVLLMSKEEIVIIKVFYIYFYVLLFE